MVQKGTGNNLTAFPETDPTTLKEKKAIKIQRLSLAKAIKRSQLHPILAPAIQFLNITQDKSASNCWTT